MNLKTFDAPAQQRLKKSNQFLKENHGITVKPFSSRSKLSALRENARQHLVQIRGNNTKFHLDPEYAKFLCIQEATDIMLNEGMYAENQEFREMIEGTVSELLRSGYDFDGACGECMNRYRMDPRWCYDDEYVLPMVITAAKKYIESMHYEDVNLTEDEQELAEGELYKKMHEVMAFPSNMPPSSRLESIREYLGELAEGMGKSTKAMEQFVTGLTETEVPQAIEMFERKIEEQNAFNIAAAEAAKAGKKQFEFPEGSGKMHPVTMSTSAADEMLGESTNFAALKQTFAKLNTAVKEGRKQDIDQLKNQFIDEYHSSQLTEEVDIDQAEVVMAAQGISAELQDQIEKLGRLMNEDLVAIVDQMRYEMGAQAAAQFQDEIGNALQTQLDNAKTAKTAVDNSIAAISGGEQTMPAEPQPDAAAPDEEPQADQDLDLDLDLDQDQDQEQQPPLGREEMEDL